MKTCANIKQRDSASQVSKKEDMPMNLSYSVPKWISYKRRIGIEPTDLKSE